MMILFARLWGLVVFLSVCGYFGRAEGTAFFPQSVASGDPTHSSVVLWTRLVPETGDEGDRGLELLVTSEGSRELAGTLDILSGDNLYRGKPVVVRQANDGCVKVRVTGLEPNRFYYYQFTYRVLDTLHISAIGRTRTAPAPDESATVRFGVFNCADYSGRYYNTLKHLIDQEADELNFVPHLGDYIYETTADPSYQTVADDRVVVFDRPEEAIRFDGFYAARSLSNYRDLYRIYRTDPVLMQVHELFPWVVIWDDHEFSDDYHGSVATYFNDRADEEDIARKQNAERAWMEYIPADIGLNEAGTGPALGDEHFYPHTRIYRSLNFGRNLDLILTDNRTHRPDHILEEDAFPGTIVIDEFFAKQLVNLAVGPGGFDQLRGLFDPYFDVAAERSYFGQPASGSQLP